MGSQMFNVDQSKLVDLRKFYKAAPRKFGVASGMLLNNLAFGTRKEAIETIHRHMTVRSKAFVARSIVVNKAVFAASLMQQKSEVGSIRRPRFSGWIEQETGKATNSTRAFLLAGRGGQKKRKAAPSARLRPAFKPLKPESMGGASANIVGFHHRAQVLLMWTYRNKWRKPFIIRGHKKIKPGLYRWKGSKLKKLQTFTPKNKQPKKFQWMKLSRGRYLFKTDMNRQWDIVLTRLLG